jgi:hypothetical protein
MKNLILVFVVFLPIFGFSQSLSDTIVLDSINYEFINEQLFIKINKERGLFLMKKFSKDTIPQLCSKYVSEYFKKYGTNNIEKDSTISFDLFNQGFYTNCDIVCPKTRLFSICTYYKNDGYFFSESQEINKIYNLSSIISITYEKFIELLFKDFENERELFNDLTLNLTSEEKYIGISSSKFETKTNDIVYSITCVVVNK